MVELQTNQEKLRAAGLQVVAVSYDSMETLRRFAVKRKITFPLLSDSDSKVIDSFGIRNREVAGGRIDGVPYPGTFIVGPQGIIRTKLFHNGYKERHTSADIIEAWRRAEASLEADSPED